MKILITVGNANAIKQISNASKKNIWEISGSRYSNAAYECLEQL